ncbi:MAG TPA: GDSL-type esterase/lipase family protein [Bacillota bacterium]|nr:hypothetical protein [Clostridiales bacterium]HPT85792.1 GDSL-type esterase/lipase family protein [Bacillota bacterium]
MDLRRLEKDVSALEAAGIIKGGIVLYGSSFFGVWGRERAKEQLSELGTVVCNGFGGSLAAEQVYYYGRLVRAFEPSALVLRGGVNDINAGITGEVAAALTILLADMAHADFPNIKIVALSVFGCPFVDGLESHKREQVKIYNDALEKAAATRDYLSVLDLTPFFTDASSGYRPLFSDGLHLTDDGYKQLAPYFISKIKELV